MGTDKAKTRTARGGAVLPGASGRASRARVREAESGDSRARNAGARDAREAGGDSREAAGSRTRDARAGEAAAKQPAESGGPAGLEPTRYGDWEKGGRCSDF